MTQEQIKAMADIINDLYWEYDRMSSSGKESLDKLTKIVKRIMEKRK